MIPRARAVAAMLPLLPSMASFGAQLLQTGGPVGSPAPGSVGDTYNLNLSFSGQVGQSSRQNARDMAAMVLAEIEKMHRGRS